MKIGIPKEIKDGENRVALTPDAVHSLKSTGYDIFVEKGAGFKAGFRDAEYKQAGAKILSSAKSLWQSADLIVKVKEPQPEEYRYLTPNKILFCYLHLAANPTLTKVLMRSGITAIAGETVQESSGRMPLLEPMSEIAGRMAVIVGSYYQANPFGGGGVLVSGLPGVLPAKVAILGGGTVGENAAKIASGIGAQVTILDTRPERLRILEELLPRNVSTLISTPENVEEAILSADIIIGAVLIPGAQAPKLISKKMIQKIKKRTVFVDVSIDQGGISETSKPTTHSHPTYLVGEVLHYCVPNMPGAYGKSATLALSNTLLPYVKKLAEKGLKKFLEEDQNFAYGLNIYKGKIVHKEVAASVELPYFSWQELL